MENVYLYNRGTGKLHIKGYCQDAKSEVGYMLFKTEDDALAYDGRAVSLCKRCMKKRELIINQKK